MIDWHRLFGLALTDFFTNSPFVVELEKDLSQKRQWLDVVILRKQPGEMKEVLPDGLENLSEHNLLSYKSLREPFDDWVFKELTGHYVNYRKQVSPSLDDLLPEEKFQLYGVSTRVPQKLSSQVDLHFLSPGVFEVIRGSDRIRLIVLSEIPQKQQNALWHLFSGIPQKVEFAANEYRRHTQEMSTIINQLFENYELEGVSMPYTMEDFQKDYVRNHLDLLSSKEVLPRFSLEERLEGFSSNEVLPRFSLEERLEGLSSDERLKGLSSDERLEGLSSDERLKGLSAEEIQAYLKQLKKPPKS